ncbi:hypothetical protein EDD18DRAFT_310991 [Armillaria luteobubalina]|uniref:Secreted protein n=1 Tax=Armillaria luteobubalina TaxID=153913 RepID=A0AA39QKQ0_9AGAR|nr:hypothetical protein EDD18DRAFT_310991 [Armillaria luteobubalina]
MYDLPAPMRTMLVVILSLVLTIDIPSTGHPNKSHPGEASALTREFEWKSAALSSSVIDSFGCKCQRQIQYDVGLSGCPSGRWLGLNGSGMICFRLLVMAGAQCRTQYRSPPVLWTQARLSEVHPCRYYGRNMLIFSAPGETGHTRIPNTHWGINPARDAPTSPVHSR